MRGCRTWSWWRWRRGGPGWRSSWRSPPPLQTDEKPPAYQTAREPRPVEESEEEFRWVVGWLNYYSHQTNLLRWLLGEEYTVEQYTGRPACDLVLVRTASGIPAFM